MIVQATATLELMESVTVCPITSVEVDASFVRVPIAEGERSGLDRASWIMADKIVTVPRSALRLPTVGKLDARELSDLEDALRNLARSLNYDRGENVGIWRVSTCIGE